MATITLLLGVDMKKILLSCLLALSIFCSSQSAQADDPYILQFTGNAYDSGNFPVTQVGDQLNAVGLLTGIGGNLVWNLAQYSYTYVIGDLMALSTVTNGTMMYTTYAGGTLKIYVDLKPSNHDYGINPPNLTCPSTFEDGLSTYFEGQFIDFALTYNHATSQGGFTGQLIVTGGDMYPLVNPAAYTFGANISGFSPEGYDFEMNGTVFLKTTVSVEDASWGAIKSLYR